MVEQVLTSLVSKLARGGVFGEGIYDSIEKDNGDIGFQFSSEVAFVKLRMRNNSNCIESLPIVVKMQVADQEYSKARDLGSMFFNEVTMYQEVLPFLNPSKTIIYPKLYYGYANGGDNIDDDVLIIQNLKYLSFTLSKEKAFLDFHHIALAMETIGKLHSWSYSAKKRDKKTLQKLANKLRLIEIKDTDEFNYSKSTYLCIKRGVDKVMENGSCIEELEKFLQAFESFNETQRLLWETEEPFGVIIHGDYCKNNLFYKYDTSDRPVEAVFFDLQNSRYGCPVTDLAFFLYMHTTAEMRDKHWDEFLEIYWNSVKDNVAEGTNLPSYDEFLELFVSKAVIAIIPVSFYLPLMLYADREISKVWLTYTNEEKINVNLNLGGEDGEAVVADVVSHLLNKGYISKFLEYFAKKGTN